MIRCAIAVVLALTAIAPAAARAQVESTRSVSLGIGGGVSLPGGTARETFRNGFNGDASVRFDFAHVPVQLRTEFLYEEFDLRGAGSTPSDTSQGTGTVLSGILGAEVYLHRGPVRPYLVAGGGLYRIKLDPVDAGIASPSSTRLGVNGGAGLVATFGGFSFYAEGRFDYLFQHGGGTDRRIVQLVPITAGVLF